MTPTGHWGEESRKGSFPGRNKKNCFQGDGVDEKDRDSRNGLTQVQSACGASERGGQRVGY